ncbi:MAG: hypothetical protein ACR2LL_13810 [Nitrosopumilus sp.]|uniref:hypothetical protein n=1 Tax=Nitrosopumilus sp. TaxID=2024843 RepID=UPI00292FC153|nr:hypothetical protein [Nitrosopumilus sp.]
MTPAERKQLEKLDNLVLHASSKELKKIQKIDSQTQLDGLSLYGVYVDSTSLVNLRIKKSSY